MQYIGIYISTQAIQEAFLLNMNQNSTLNSGWRDSNVLGSILGLGVGTIPLLSERGRAEGDKICNSAPTNEDIIVRSVLIIQI